MKMCRLVVVATATMAATVLFTSESDGQCAAPWQRLDRNVGEMAKPLPLALILGSAVPPLLLAPTGTDYSLRQFAQADLGGSYSPELLSLWAPLGTIAGTTAVWGLAVAVNSCDWQSAPTAMIQGMVWTLGTVTLVKWTTGRTWPNGGRDPYRDDRLDYPGDARRFQPFTEVLTAFPSGHTAVMFAAASALRSSSPEIGVIRYVGYPVAAAVGFGMWWGDHHWASDVISGAMMGEAIGASAGRTWSDGEEEKGTLSFFGMPGGAALVYRSLF